MRKITKAKPTASVGSGTKLRLNRESLRALDGDQLTTANGGRSNIFGTCFITCETTKSGR